MRSLQLAHYILVRSISFLLPTKQTNLLQGLGYPCIAIVCGVDASLTSLPNQPSKQGQGDVCSDASSLSRLLAE